MKKRIITAIIALILFTPIILYGGWPFVVIVNVLATIALFELVRMYQGEVNFKILFLGAIFLWGLINVNNELNVFKFNYTIDILEIIIAFVMVLLIITVLSKNKFTFDDASFLFLATVYMSIGFSLLIVARMEGLNYLFYILFVIWATDTGAYFFGRSLGKRKLWPAISPNKTIGGALGGIFTAIIVGVIFQVIQPFHYSLSTIILITLVISVMGQMGDLAASAIKRHYEVKDAGRIFPGHGGILDRLDSLIFVLPILYLIQFI